jgi:hypothetical protein
MAENFEMLELCAHPVCVIYLSVWTGRHFCSIKTCCMMMAVFWDVALMMEAVSSSETSVNIYQTTWCNIPKDSHLHTLHTGHRVNLKSYLLYDILQ